MEKWRDVPDYEDLYEISNLGNVWSKRCKRLLKPSTTSTGYKKIELYKDGTRKSFKVHRLVLYGFVGVKKDLVNHKDGNPFNNHLVNLEYCNQSRNMKHAYETGLMKCNLYGNEERIIHEYQSGMNIKELSRKYKINNRTIRNFLVEKEIEIKGISESQRKYNIDFTELKKMIDSGMRNVDIAKAFNTNSSLIGQYKYMMKKGEIIC